VLGTLAYVIFFIWLVEASSNYDPGPYSTY
jgi:hypothetical protein